MLLFAPYLQSIPKTLRCMVIYHPHSLHKSVASSRANEAEAVFFKLLAHLCASFSGEAVGSLGEFLATNETP